MTGRITARIGEKILGREPRRLSHPARSKASNCAASAAANSRALIRPNMSEKRASCLARC